MPWNMFAIKELYVVKYYSEHCYPLYSIQKSRLHHMSELKHWTLFY